MNTIDSILEALEKMAENKEPIDASTWLTGASKLIALIGNEQDRLYTLESDIARNKALFMEDGTTASGAKIKAEALPEFLESRKLKAKIERVFEIIRISKIMARMSQDEYRSN